MCHLTLLAAPPPYLQTKRWRAYYSFPRCVRDLFSTTLLLVGLPQHLRSNEVALRNALSRYGTISNLQVRRLADRLWNTA